MHSAALPPLDLREIRRSPGDRLLSTLIVVLLHGLLVYALLYLSVKNDLVQLPPSISVRLLPLQEEKRPETRRPQQTQTSATPKRQQSLPQPVLAVEAPVQANSFSVPSQPPAPPVQVIAAAPAPVATSLTPARFDADYLHNPKPVYPAISRRMSEEGKVLLKVKVSPQGQALEVSISKSSGFTRLDTAASDAVNRWRFVPARRGDEPVESTVLVPITFALE